MADEEKKAAKPDHPERARLLKAFAEGGLVLRNGQLLRNEGDVPSNEEFEKADETAQTRVAQRLLEKRDALDARIAALPQKAEQRTFSQASPEVGVSNQMLPPDAPADGGSEKKGK